MKHTSFISSNCCSVEGNLFLPEQIQQVFVLKNLRQTPKDYALAPGLTLKDECARAFTIAKASWNEFSDVLTRTDLSENDRLSRTLRFAENILGSCLGYRLTAVSCLEVDERVWPIRFLADGMPVCVAAAPLSLDEASPMLAVTGSRARKTAFQVTQEFLNASSEHRWGMAFCGTAIRLVRDAMSLTRPSYLEFNLQEMLQTEDYSEFLRLWVTLHASRAIVKGSTNVWDDWIKNGEETGQTAREFLSGNINLALECLGNGFLEHPGNEALRQSLACGEFSAKDYGHELLRLMYRFLFLFCVEERDLLNTKDDTPETETARLRYETGYSMRRFREMADKRRFHDKHHDAWESVKIVFASLAEGQPLLALPALGGLFASSQCPHLVAAKLTINGDGK